MPTFRVTKVSSDTPDRMAFAGFRQPLSEARRRHLAYVVDEFRGFMHWKSIPSSDEWTVISPRERFLV